jgi:hypothetical protein
VALVRADVSEELSASFTASVDPSSPLIVTLMKEALSSSETSVLTTATRRNTPEDDILHSHRRENLKSYNRQTHSVDFSPQANYTDRATAIGRRILEQSFVDRGVSRCQRGGSRTLVNLSFLYRSRYFCFK